SGFFLVANNFAYDAFSGHLDATQSGTATTIETFDARIWANSVFRNSHVWTVHHGGRPAPFATDRTAVLWYELDPTLLQTTGNPIVQSGVVDGGSGVHHYYPSLAVNALDDAVVGF